MEVWTESALGKLLRPIVKVYKVDTCSEIIPKWLFARVCIVVDLSKPLKIEIKYPRDGVIHSYLLHYKNITDICYSCGSRDHKFDYCILNSKKIAFRIKNAQRFHKLQTIFSPIKHSNLRPMMVYGEMFIQNVDNLIGNQGNPVQLQW